MADKAATCPSETIQELRKLANEEEDAKAAAAALREQEEKRREAEIAKSVEDLRKARQDGIGSCINFMLAQMRRALCMRVFRQLRKKWMLRTIEVETEVYAPKSGPELVAHAVTLEAERKKAKQKSLRSGPQWQGANMAHKRLVENPKHGIITPSDLGGTKQREFSKVPRDAVVVGDPGNSDAAHIEPGAYPGATPDLFSPNYLPNVFLSIVPRFGHVVGDTGATEAAHLEPGRYELKAEESPAPVIATLRSKTSRDTPLLGSVKAGEGVTNPNTGPGFTNLQKYQPFGDTTHFDCHDLSFPGAGYGAWISENERWGTSGWERHKAKVLDQAKHIPLGESATALDAAKWQCDGGHRLREGYPSPRAAASTFNQAPRFTPRRAASVEADKKDFARGQAWMAHQKGYRPPSAQLRRPPTIKELGDDHFLTGKSRDPGLVAKVQRYRSGETDRLPLKCRTGGRRPTSVASNAAEATAEGPSSPTSELGASGHLRTIDHEAATSGNIYKASMKSQVKRVPESMFWLGRSITEEMEIGQYSGGLVEFVESIRTWGLSTAKERFRLNAKGSGVSLEQALEEERNKKRKVKLNPWRCSDEPVSASHVLKSRLGSGGMPRKAEMAMLKEVDRHLAHSGRGTTWKSSEMSNGPPFNTSVVRGR